MSERKAPRVLLAVSGDAESTSRLPKLFHDAGAEVWVVCPEGFRITGSRYVRRHIAAADSCAAVLQRTRETIVSERVDSVIITSDRLLYEIYRSEQTNWIDRYLPVQRNLGTSLIASKNGFLRGCMDAGITVPAFQVCTSLNETLAAAEQLGYPVMIKLEEGTAGTGVRRVDSADEIGKLFADGFVDKPLAVQQYIEGRIGTTAILYRKGEPVYVTSSYARHCWPTPFSPQTMREIVDREVFKQIALLIGKMTQFDGLAGIDWIEDSAGRVYVIELNARPTPLHLIAPSLPTYARALDAIQRGEPVPPLRRRERNGQVYRVFPLDFYRVFAQRDLRGFVLWIVTMPFSRSVPWDDLPLLRLQFAQLAAYFNRQIRGMTARVFARLSGAFER